MDETWFREKKINQDSRDSKSVTAAFSNDISNDKSTMYVFNDLVMAIK